MDGERGKGDKRGTLDEPDPGAPPTAEEIAAAEALRLALDEPRQANASADFARAVSLAHAPRSIPAEEHRAIVEQAIERAESRRGARVDRSFARRMAGPAVVAGGLALAAAIALAIGTTPFDRASAPRSSVSSTEPLVPVRSTQPLFREPFARAGGESARIDRIASARSADLRDNRFAAWGVK